MNKFELRLGNWVRTNKAPEFIYKIVGLSSVWATLDCIKGISDFGDTYYQDLSPILLTDKHLLTFGFDKIDWKHIDGSISKNIYKKDNIVIVKDLDDSGYVLCIVSPGTPRKFNYAATVEYVHQLQNLYHALTLEDL